MLTLSRKSGETIVLVTDQGEITVTIASVRGVRVFVGVDAPRDIAIYRGESNYWKKLAKSKS